MINNLYPEICLSMPGAHFEKSALTGSPAKEHLSRSWRVGEGYLLTRGGYLWENLTRSLEDLIYLLAIPCLRLRHISEYAILRTQYPSIDFILRRIYHGSILTQQ